MLLDLLSLVSPIPQVTCSPGHLGFNTTVNTTINSVSYVTGTPTVCVNGNNLPICNGTSLNMSTLSRICLLSTGFTTVCKLEKSIMCAHF